MPFIGTPIDTRNQFQALQGKRFDGDGSTTAFTLDVAPSSTLDIEVFVGNVRQDPNSAYSVSGTTLTFTGAPPSGTNNIYVVHQAKAVGTIEVPATNSGNTTFNGTITMNGGVVLNEESADVDFRVESNGNANMFVVNGGGDRVGIGADPDLGSGLHIKTADSGGSVDSGSDELVIEGSGDAGMTILTGTSNTGAIRFGDSGGNTIGGIQYNHTDNECLIRGNNATCISAGAAVVINDDSADMDFRVESNGNTHMIFVDAGSDFVAIGKNNGTTSNVGNYFSPNSENHFTVPASTVAVFNREDNGSGQNYDGAVIAFRANNSEQGTISISGSTTSYNAFSGAHWGRLSDNSTPTILRGTVIESIATMIDWYIIKMTNSDGYEFHEEIALPNGKSAGDTISHTAKDGVTYNGVIEKQMNEQLPMTKISDTEDSKAVYGVFNSWDNEPDDGVNDMLVTGLGAFIIRVHKDETLAIGDLLSSKGDGTAKKQADDILRASTIAKVTSTTKIETYSDGSYCVPCTLHCG